MGCECSLNNLNKLIYNDADVNIKKDIEIKSSINSNKILNSNNNQKEDNIIEAKIPEETDLEKEKEKNNKLKKSKIEEHKDDKNEEEQKFIEKKTEDKEKLEEKEKDNSQEKSEQNECISKNHYNQRVFDLINQIRLNPSEYSQTILDNINNIITETHKVVNKETGIVEAKQTFVFKKKVKVNLFRGEECFREAAEILKNTQSMNKFKFNKDIVIPLPDNENDIINSTFIKSKASEIRTHNSISVYFKEYIKNPEIAVLLMIVDDRENSNGKKRECLLNPNLKYIGINSKFIGKNFIAHFSFS